MALTRDYKKTIEERIERDPDFAKALLEQASELFLSGEPDIARLILRDLVNSTMGFEHLATKLGIMSKSLHRMLSTSGNPSMNNLSSIFAKLSEHLNVKINTSVQ